jgi:hypothetical protein
LQAAIAMCEDERGTTICFDTHNAQARAQARQAATSARLQYGRTVDAQRIVQESQFVGSAEDMSWVKAHLQKVPLPNGTKLLVLHWSHLPNDKYTIGMAQQRRRESMTRLGIQLRDQPSNTSALNAGATSAPIDTQTKQSSIISVSGALNGGVTVGQMPAWHPVVSPGSTKGSGCTFDLKVGVLDLQWPSAQNPLANPTSLESSKSGNSADDGKPTTAMFMRSTSIVLCTHAHNVLLPLLFTASLQIAAYVADSASVAHPTIYPRDKPARRPSTTKGIPIGASAVSPTMDTATDWQAMKTAVKSPHKQSNKEQDGRRVLMQLSDHHDDDNGAGAFPGQRPKKGSRYNVRQNESTDVHSNPLDAAKYQHATDESEELGAKQSEVNIVPVSSYGMDSEMRSEVLDENGSAIRFVTSFKEPDGDRSSVASSQGGAIRRMQDRLRKIVTDKNQRLLPKLRLLRWTGIGTLLATVLLGILTVSIVTSQLEAFAGIQKTVTASNEGMICLNQAFISANQLHMPQRGWTTLTPPQESLARKTLGTAVGKYLQVVSALQDVATTRGLSKTYSNTMTQFVVVTLNLAGTVNTRTPTQMSLLEAGVMYEAAGLELVATPIVNVTKVNPSRSMVFQNAKRGAVFYSDANATTFAWATETERANKGADLQSLAIYIFMVVMLVTVSCGMIFPILLHVDQTRDDYLMPLLGLPVVISTKLRSYAERHLRQLLANEADDDGVGDTASDESMDEIDLKAPSKASMNEDEEVGGFGADMDWRNLIAANSVTGKNQRTTSSKSAQPDGYTRRKYRKPSRVSVDVDADGNATGAVKGGRWCSTTGRVGSRTYQKSRASVLGFAVKFMLPVGVILAFFTSMFSVLRTNVAQVSTLSKVNAIGCVRDREVYEFEVAVLAAVTTTGSPTNAQLLSALDLAFDAADSLEYHHRLLTFGGPIDPAYDVASGSLIGGLSSLADSQNSDIKRSLFSNPCSLLLARPDFLGTAAECASLANGLVARGIHPTMLEYLRLGRLLTTRRQTANISESSASGVGTIKLEDGSTQVYSIGTEVKSADFITFTTLAEKYLQIGVDVIGDNVQAAAQAKLLWLRTFAIGFTSTFLVVAVLFLILVYLPRINKLNREIKDQRLMMLLLPASLVQSVPALTDAFASLLENEDVAARRL